VPAWAVFASDPENGPIVRPFEFRRQHRASRIPGCAEARARLSPLRCRSLWGGPGLGGWTV